MPQSNLERSFSGGRKTVGWEGRGRADSSRAPAGLDLAGLKGKTCEAWRETVPEPTPSDTPKRRKKPPTVKLGKVKKT